MEGATFGVDAKPILAKIGPDLVARWTARFDKMGNRLELVRYGLDEKPLPNAEAQPKPIVEKDVIGRIVSAMLHDLKGVSFSSTISV